MSRPITFFALLLMLSGIPSSAPGSFVVESASYQEMFDKADLIVIAKPVSTAATTERTMLMPGKFHVIGISTDFETRVVFKGDKKVKIFVLHHYKLDPDIEKLVIINGPRLVDINLGKDKAFLLFLIKETDGRYAPVSGQIGPWGLSVIELDSFAE
jgi:hypothetical protein